MHLIALQTLGEQLLLFLIALIANLLSSLAGGGAGLLQLPALLFLGLPFALAITTHKIASVALGIGASIRHARGQSLSFGFGSFMLAAGLPGVILGAHAVLHIPEDIARIALGVVTCGLGVYSFCRKTLGQEENVKRRDLTGYLVGGTVLFAIGFLNGAFASGTGLFVTLWLVIWFGMDYQRAIANTMLLVGLFWNATGAFTLALLTPVQWEWLPALLLGSLAGGFVGAHLAITKGNPFIKRVFEIVTLSVGASLITSSLF
jgi:uncharacterized membrane protein YfcA